MYYWNNLYDSERVNYNIPTHKGNLWILIVWSFCLVLLIRSQMRVVLNIHTCHNNSDHELLPSIFPLIHLPWQCCEIHFLCTSTQPQSPRGEYGVQAQQRHLKCSGLSSPRGWKNRFSSNLRVNDTLCDTLTLYIYIVAIASLPRSLVR